MAEQGQGAAGLAQMRQGLVAYQATGAAVFRPYYLAFLAEAYGKVGQAGEGLSLLGEALAAVHKTGERFYEAELHRSKESYCWCALPRTLGRPKPLFSRPCLWRVTNRRNL